MGNSFFQFKEFTVHQEHCAMKVTTDACLFGAWAAQKCSDLNAENSTVLDIGTGTGLLSLMLVQKNFHLFIDALEIDKAAATQAVSNIAASPWKNKIQVINADVRSFKSNHLFDFIICNPPFYENELKSTDRNKNIAHHNEGLTFQNLFSLIKSNLEPNGSFFLLFPFKRNIEIQTFLNQQNFEIVSTTMVRQSIKHGFFRILLHGKINSSSNPIKTTIDEISIFDENQKYTTQFVSLLKDYYLHL